MREEKAFLRGVHRAGPACDKCDLQAKRILTRKLRPAHLLLEGVRNISAQDKIQTPGQRLILGGWWGVALGGIQNVFSGK